MTRRPPRPSRAGHPRCTRLLRGLADEARDRARVRAIEVARALAAPVPEARPVQDPPIDVALGEVPVVDLFVILVETHRLDVRDAVRRLSLAMLAAGYPPDNDTVSALDAMEILEAVLEGQA